MAAGLAAYRQVLADPRARAFSLAGLVARLPISMTGIGTVLLVSLTTGSFGQAGLVTAAITVTGALCAPLWGRAIDRVGQAPVLVSASLVCVAGQAVLIASILLGWPFVVSMVAAAVVGAGFSSAGSAVRARWSHRLQGSPLLDTGFAVEAVWDEVVFVIGPVLVTFLATAVHPALGLGASAAVGLVGALVLAAQRDTEPPRSAGRRSAASHGRLDPFLLVPLALASVALGAVFGGVEVVVVAFATETGVLPYAGTILMAWALGSLVAGVVVGAVTWRRSPAARFRAGAVALALSTLPMPFVREPLLMALLLVVSGMAIAPTMIASVAVTQAGVPQGRLTEALAYSSTGLAGGLAAGAAGLGQLIDRGGSTLGFWGVVAAGVLLIISASCVRARPAVGVPAVVDAPAGESEQADEPTADQVPER